MIDRVTAEKRSWNMSQIKGKNTRPELIVRKALFAEGFRYRLHRKDLPGKPDIVFKKYKTVIFVHGCFWHQHTSCSAGRLPNSNQKFWVAKLESNRSRDMRVQKELVTAGWKVLVVWECETKTKQLDALIQRLKQELICNMQTK